MRARVRPWSEVRGRQSVRARARSATRLRAWPHLHAWPAASPEPPCRSHAARRGAAKLALIHAVPACTCAKAPASGARACALAVRPPQGSAVSRTPHSAQPREPAAVQAVRAPHSTHQTRWTVATPATAARVRWTAAQWNGRFTPSARAARTASGKTAPVTCPSAWLLAWGQAPGGSARTPARRIRIAQRPPPATRPSAAAMGCVSCSAALPLPALAR
jgi:hypothetical protein